MLLERWSPVSGFAPWGATQLENHNRNASHRQWATAQEHPGEEEKTQKDEPDEKTLRPLLNQVIQEIGHTRAMNLRVFHTIL